MEIKQVNPPDQSDPAYLWRYVDIYRLLDFVKTGSLFLSRLDSFEDPHEAISQNQILTRSSELPVVLLGFMSKTITKTKELNLEDRQKRYFAQSWFMCGNESLAMWKLYAGNYGFAIKIKADYLINLIEQEQFVIENTKLPLRLFHGKISYVNINDINLDNFHLFNEDTKVLGFQKDISFSHEKEYRFLLKIAQGSKLTKEQLDTLKKGIKIKPKNFDWSKITVFLNPNMPRWASKHSEEILKQLNSSLNVSRSIIKLR